jgi:hypothetical protein
MWHAGKDHCSTGVIAHTYSNWSEAISDIHASASDLPHWMNNLFYWGKQERRDYRGDGALIPISIDLGEIFPEFRHIFK